MTKLEIGWALWGLLIIAYHSGVWRFLTVLFRRAKPLVKHDQK